MSLEIDTMRRLDRWIGTPVCALLSLVDTLGRPFRRASSETPKRVLFIELAEMGSTVLAIPAVDQLKRSYPGCDVFFLAFKHIEETVSVAGLVPPDRVFTIDVSNVWTLLRDTWRCLVAMRRAGIDTVVNLEMFSRFSAALSYLSGARRRAGFAPFAQRGVYIGRLLTHRVVYHGHLHVSQAFMALVDALADPPHREPAARVQARPKQHAPKHPSPAGRRADVRRLIRDRSPNVSDQRLIVVSPSSSGLLPVRAWPLDRYAQLISRLLEDAANVCVLIGLESDKPDADTIVRAVASDRLVDLTGATTLADVVALFDQAALLVANDGGAAHIAALTDIDVVVFFGPETPDLYAPLTERCVALYAGYACSPCVSAYNQRKTLCTNNVCLQAFTVEHVLAVVNGALDRRRRAANEAHAVVS